MVEQGVTGYIADDDEELVAAVGLIGNRSAYGARLEQLFSNVVVIDACLAIYAETLSARNARRAIGRAKSRPHLQ